MAEVERFAAHGGPGARHLQRLPGVVRVGHAARRPASGTSLRFVCRQVDVDVVNLAHDSGRPHARRRQRHAGPAPTGRYWAPDPVLDELEANGQVVLRCATGNGFNGSTARHRRGQQPRRERGRADARPSEHAVDPLTGSADGLRLFESAARTPRTRPMSSAGRA